MKDIIFSPEMPQPIVALYQHIFEGGSLDQIDASGVKILVLNPKFSNKGLVKRKSAGTLYDRDVVYLHGDGPVLMRPDDWTHVDAAELQEKLDNIGA